MERLMVGPTLVGGAFIVGAVAKALPPRDFIYRLYQLPFAPRTVPWVAVAALGLEGALGATLVAGLGTPWTEGVGVFVVLAFSVFTEWMLRTRRAEECGCYGSRWVLKPWQSRLLNAIYMALLMQVFWAVPSPDSSMTLWLVPLAAGILCSAIAAVQVHWLIRYQRVLWDFAAVKPGGRWQRSWSPAGVQAPIANGYVAWFSARCERCDKWIPLLNAVYSAGVGTPVLGLVTGSPEFVARVGDEKGATFPIAAIDRVITSRVLNLIPTVVRVRHGVIVAKWEGEPPTELTL